MRRSSARSCSSPWVRPQRGARRHGFGHARALDERHRAARHRAEEGVSHRVIRRQRHPRRLARRGGGGRRSGGVDRRHLGQVEDGVALRGRGEVGADHERGERRLCRASAARAAGGRGERAFLRACSRPCCPSRQLCRSSFMSTSFHPRCSGRHCHVSVSRRMRSSSSRSRWKCTKKARALEGGGRLGGCEGERVAGRLARQGP